MSQTLSYKQIQEMSLKPQMIQSLKMLALPMMDLELELKNEIVANPLLEIVEDYEEDNQKAENEELEISNEDKEIQQTLDEVKELSEILDTWNEYHDDKEISSKSLDEEDSNYDNFIKVEDNLKKEFIEFIEQYDINDQEKDFAFEIIERANEYGFLPPDYDIYEVAAEYSLTIEEADKVHQMILRTIPRGITARNIEECLIAQLEEYELDDWILVSIIKNDFSDLIHRKFQNIADKYELSENEVLAFRERISLLDPKPGMRLNSSKANYIVPDIIVRKIEDDYEVIINDFYIPKIVLSKHYRSMLQQSSKDKETVKYIRSKVNSAKFLIKSIFMRNRTLERVMRSIIYYQKNFFYNNSGLLDPLTYSVIANDLSVNESTISRVVKHKYADTPFGIMCLKDFFCSAAGKDKNYESVSRQNVQIQISEMIEKEDKRNPLSDQELVDILKERGISVSRRVIAKYREELKIPNSRLRRK